MKTSEPYVWEYVTSIPGEGMRIFRCRSNQRLAIAGDSGPYPEDCEGGILWLDMSERVLSATPNERGGFSVIVPLFDLFEMPVRTSTTLTGAMMLCKLLPWRVVVQAEGKAWRIEEAES